MTEQQKALVASALSNCMVIGNKINFFKNFTEDEIKLIYAGITEDIFAYNIPHYRVIGIKYPNDKLHTTSVIRKNGAFNDSVIKLADKCANIVPIDLGGNDREKSCYCFSDTPVMDKSGTENMAIFRSAEKIPDWKKNKMSIDYNPDLIGQLMYIIGIGDKGDKVASTMSTRTLYYKEFSIEEAMSKPHPRFLIDNVDIADIQYTEAPFPSEITLFYYKGTGILDYSQTADLFNNDSGIFPCRTSYDLGRFFTIRYPQEERDGLVFYTPMGSNLNTYNLTEILKEYAKGLQVEEDGN